MATSDGDTPRSRRTSDGDAARSNHAEDEDIARPPRSGSRRPGTGKLRRQQAMRQHLFEKKPSTRTRRLAGDVDVHPTDVKKIKRLLAER